MRDGFLALLLTALGVAPATAVARSLPGPAVGADPEDAADEDAEDAAGADPEEAPGADGPPAPPDTAAPTPPELIGPVEPEVPAGVTGEVVLRLQIDAEGLVTSAEVRSATDDALREPVLTAARGLVFLPATQDGSPIAAEIEFTWTFDPPPLARLQGRVVSRATGAALAGVSVSVGLDHETRTDVDGAFSIDLPPGEHRVVIYLDGHDRLVETARLGEQEGLTLEIALAPTVGGDETVVSSRRPWREVERAPLLTEGPAAGRWDLTRRDLQLSAGSMGDVARALAQLPGVAADTGMFALLFVRGADSDETVFTLDGVQLLNPNHLSGTFTVFNPELVERVSLHATPPASLPDGLGGVVEVEYLRPDRRQVDGVVDANLAMGSAWVAGPLGKPGAPATFLLSARRSWFEAYLGLLQAARVFPRGVSIAFGEYLGRVEVGDANSPMRLRVGVLHSHDGLVLEDDDDALVRFGSPITNKAAVTLLHADWRGTAGPVRADIAGWLTRDAEERQQVADFSVTRRTVAWRPGVRGQLTLTLQPEHRLSLGVQGEGFSFDGDGRIKDPRVAPTWVALPWARLTQREIEFDARRSWTELAAWVQDDARWGPLEVQSGLRLRALGPTGEVLASPRVSVAVRAPTQTTFKVGAGIFHQPVRDPLVLDDEVGAADPRAERAFQVAGGVTQLLPPGFLVRAEGYYRRMDRLAVHPDTTSALDRGQSYQHVGRGQAAGLDASVGFRLGRFGALASYALSWSQRTNPLNEAGPQTFLPAWDQRHALRLNGEAGWRKQKTDFRVAGMWELRSGRPRTPVSRRQNVDGAWEFVPYAYDSASYRTWTELSVRVEAAWPIARGKARIATYLDVLNSTMAQGQFIWIYDQGDEEAGAPPTPFIFRQLPIRPWVGLRIEF